MTLIVAVDSNGVYGRCDAKCHDATGPKCTCICGGVYHGKGSGTAALRQAIKDRGDAVVVSLRAAGAKVDSGEEVVQRELL
jgi:hypothetical protein